MECSMQHILLVLAVVITIASGVKHSITEEFNYHEVSSSVFISGELYDQRDYKDKLIHSREVILSLVAYNKSFSIPLVLTDNLFSNNYIEKHIMSANESVINKPANNLHRHCYYQSSSAAISAAISTCDGISGYFSDSNGIYYIYPMSGHANHHYILRRNDHIIPDGRCGVDHTAEFKLRRKRSVHKPYDANSDSRYVELFMVADSREYDDMGRDEYKLIHRIKEIVNIVNSLFKQLNIYIALVGIEIWRGADQIVIESSADKTMNNFLVYRKQHINPHHKNDNAQLLSGRKFDDGIVGKAMKEPICTFLYSGGVSYDSSVVTKVVAVTLAHEMGHNFGFEHDDESCTCADSKCIMAAVSGMKFPTKWSSCSRKYLEEAFDAGMDYCLQDLPDNLHDMPLCGNGFVERGEECDCGLPEDCTSKCCDALTCRLVQNATCATGDCCDKETCQMKSVFTECRAANAECDLPEFCSGKSEYCPVDIYKEDGSDCDDETAYCYNGKCNTYDAQCQFLWGPTGRKGHELCYTKLNHEGTGNGNCGFDWQTKEFKACQPQDVFCGMLHCYHTTEKLHFWKPSLTYLMPELHITTSQGERHFCQSVILDVGYHTPDPGMVPDGTKCGRNMMCMNQQCLTKRQLNFPTCASNCSNNGVCNNKGHCHCDCGYAPPYCNTTGQGGSIQSGPMCSGLSYSFQWSIIIILLIIIVLIIVVVVLILLYRNRIRIWFREKNYLIRSRIGRCSELLTKCPPTRRPTPSAPPTVPELEGQSKPAAKAQRSVSINRGQISGPIFQSTTLESGHLVELQKPLYENEVFRPGNKKARPPSLADKDPGPKLPPRSELYLTPKLAPGRPAPAAPNRPVPPSNWPPVPTGNRNPPDRRPPTRPAPITGRAPPSGAQNSRSPGVGLSPADIIARFNQNKV